MHNTPIIELREENLAKVILSSMSKRTIIEVDDSREHIHYSCSQPGTVQQNINMQIHVNQPGVRDVRAM